MSHSLALEEDRIGSHTFKDVAGLGGDEFLMVQSLGLFGTAVDTTMTFLTYLFYELAVNGDVQRRLQAFGHAHQLWSE